jgi:hypothetical protein
MSGGPITRAVADSAADSILTRAPSRDHLGKAAYTTRLPFPGMAVNKARRTSLGLYDE